MEGLEEHPNTFPRYLIALLAAMLAAGLLVFGLMQLPRSIPDQPESDREDILAGKQRMISGTVKLVDPQNKSLIFDTTAFRDGGEYEVFTSPKTLYELQTTISYASADGNDDIVVDEFDKRAPRQAEPPASKIENRDAKFTDISDGDQIIVDTGFYQFFDRLDALKAQKIIIFRYKTEQIKN